MRRYGPRPATGAEKATKNLNVELVLASWDRLYRIGKRLAETKGWTHCGLQQTIQFLIDQSPLGEPAGRKPAGIARNGRNGKTRTA